MTRWRVGVAVLVLLVVGLPLLVPFIEWWRADDSGQIWDEHERILLLARNTTYLVGGTLVLALPAGIVGAFLLYRTNLPLRDFWHFLVILALFVPLPLFASAWQATLGSGGWLPAASWSTPPPGDPDVPPQGPGWKPWAQGLPAAIWIHAVASLPWVILIVGQGLRWIEPELEEDALLVFTPWQVFWHVSLRRARGAIIAAAVWVALQTAAEITVTDMLQVRTFAEEIYYQFVLGDSSALARSVTVNMPLIVIAAGMVVGLILALRGSLPPLTALRETEQGRERLRFDLGWARTPALAIIILMVLLLAGVPLISLVWKAGLSGSPETFSGRAALVQIEEVFQTKGGLILRSVVLALLAGGLTAALALVASWLAGESPVLLAVLLGTSVVAWTLPAPLIGLGLKETISLLMDAEDTLSAWLGVSVHPVRSQFYEGPALLPWPVLWVSVIRFFPFALALVWPVLRLFPRELRDTARLDGLSPAEELVWVIWPITLAAYLRATLAVAILTLGEISAGKFVEMPGAQTLAHELFNQMHYGVKEKLAAFCLVLLLLVSAGTGALSLTRKAMRIS